MEGAEAEAVDVLEDGELTGEGGDLVVSGACVAEVLGGEGVAQRVVKAVVGVLSLKSFWS